MSNFKIAVENSHKNKLLEKFSQQNELVADGYDVRLASTANGIVLEHNIGAKKPLLHSINIDSFVKQQPTFPAPKQGALNQAIGKQTKTVLDVTAGWGGDALLLCSQGYQVTMVERNPVMALMLSDAMARLAQTEWVRRVPASVPSVVHIDSKTFLETNVLTDIDCIYLDPMFPPKRKKSAVANKDMQLLQKMVGYDLDANELLAAALNSSAKRAIVKRPNYAESLLIETRKPDIQFSSKLVHYDVYLIK